MSAPFHQIIPYVENALADIRGRGMGGNIVRDPDSVQSYPYRASWTGQEYILAFAGDPNDYRLELCRVKDGQLDPIRTETDPAKFDALIMDFVVKEG